MLRFFQDLMAYPFLRNAVLAAVLASVAAGLTGSLVVVRRSTYLAGAVSHNLSVVTGHATHVLCINRTAGLHAIGDVASATFNEAFGGCLTAIRHDAGCHVMDPTAALHAPHQGCGCGKEPGTCCASSRT